MKRTKKFNQEWSEAIALLPVNQQQSLIEAIRTYQNDGIEPQGLHPIAHAVFIVIKPTIDARARRCAYQKERRKRLNKSCLRDIEPEIPKSPSTKALTATNTKEESTDSSSHRENPLVKDNPIPTVPPDINPDKPSPRHSRQPRQPNRFLRQVERARQSRRGIH